MSALARWCFRHRLLVVGIWAAVLVALAVPYATLGTHYSDEFSLPGLESSKAQARLQASEPQQSGDSDQIVVHVRRDGSIRDAAVRQKVTSMLDRVAALPSVTSVTSMYGPTGAPRISKDGRTAYATVTFDAQAERIPAADVTRVIDTARAARDADLQVELGGQAISLAAEGKAQGTEAIGLVAAGIILFVAFGSLLGMLLPLLVAIAALGAGLLAVGLTSHVMTLGTDAPTVAALIGLGVGIDYALFIVTRHRTGLRNGLTPEEAAVRALNTSGRAVVFAGLTVVTALLGLLVLRIGPLTGMGISAATAVLATVIAAVTLLPALLGLFGGRLLNRRQRRAVATRNAGTVHPPLNTQRHATARPRAAGPSGSSATGLCSPWPRSLSSPSSRCPRCRCAWGPRTPGTTRRAPPPEPRTTCSSRASAPAPTVRWCWSRSWARPATRRPWTGWSRPCAVLQGWPRRRPGRSPRRPDCPSSTWCRPARRRTRPRAP